MIRFVFTVLAVLAFSASAAVAASSCYTKAEAEAEQGIRIQSELMVIGLNCQHVATAGRKNLYAAYREFAAQHSYLFAEYEDRLLNYYKRTGAGNPEAQLNTMRTVVANRISLDAAKMRPDIFCYYYAPRIQKASAMNGQTLRQWAATFYPSHPASRPVCQ